MAGITDDERTRLWKRLDYFEDKGLGKEFDDVLERSISTLNGITEAERVQVLNGNPIGSLPDSWLNSMVEKVKSTSMVIPKWKPFIRAMKKAFRHEPCLG
jgi:hypothetical protein